jgi:NAD(P)-dependent dehydrogenase (short-subunit alcohol dehydrogenase family)
VGQKVLITGHSRGLGEALARLHSDLGFEVTGVSSKEVDLANATAVEGWLKQFDDTNSPDRIILNAASIAPDLTNGLPDFEKFSHELEINLLANQRIIAHFLPIFLKRSHGQFCAVSSLSAFRAIGVSGMAYCTSKAALSMLFECLRVNYAATPIQFLTVFPGRMSTSADFENVARKTVRALAKGKERLIVDFLKYFVILCSRMVSDRWVGLRRK